jgi:hypothetical protein
VKKLSDTFVRTALASGAIVPPPDRPQTSACNTLAAVGWIIAFLGASALAVAYFLERV